MGSGPLNSYNRKKRVFINRWIVREFMFFLSEKRKEKWKKGKERLEATTSTISDIFYLVCQGNYVFFYQRKGRKYSGNF